MDSGYFKRQIELWGEDKQRLLEEKSILIVGAGGLGSSLGFALGGSGIGHITIVDFDKVSKHNIHRQIAFDLASQGEFKVDVLAKKIVARYDGVKVNTINSSFKEAIDSLGSFDLILDATDNFQTRGEIDRYAKSKNTPWIYCSVEEFMAQICFFEKSSFSSFATKNHTPKGIAAPIVMLAASLEANLALRFLAGEKIQKDRFHYIYFDKNGSLELKKFNFQ
ncbi:MAG: HesA/MoeB/ThiF family protein [Campylobacterales bacterium]